MNFNYIGDAHEYEVKMLVQAFFPLEKLEPSDSMNEYGLEVQVNEANVTITFKTPSFTKTHQIELHPNYNRLTLKNSIKIGVYDVLKEATQKELNWGILTGIRPVKLVFEAMDQGLSEEEIRHLMSGTYRINQKKIDLMMEVAQTEYPIKKTNKANEINLYIGIPFCPSKCSYCSFSSYPIKGWHHMVQPYVDALVLELETTLALLNEEKIKTLYIGGGTPTTLSIHQFSQIFDVLDKYHVIDRVEEFTLEGGRPETLNFENMSYFKSKGVTRLSINPQTMNQETLMTIGRFHQVEDIEIAFKLAKDLAFDSINADIILGLPNETLVDCQNTLEKVIALDPDNITVHTMAIKKGSKLKEQTTANDFNQEKIIHQMIEETHSRLHSAGYQPYYLYRQKNMVGSDENTGYCKPNKESIYNVEIMEEWQTIVAVGAGAISKAVFVESNRIERSDNMKSVKDYIERIDEVLARKRAFIDLTKSV